MQFLLENPIDNIKASVDIGGRLTGMKFSIQPITDTQIDEANLKATKHGKSARVKTSIMHTEIILAGCTEPNFRDEGSISKMGVSTPEAIEKLASTYNVDISAYQRPPRCPRCG